MTESMVCQQTVEEREQLFIMLYQEAFPAVAQFVSQRGGSLEEAKEVFQEALVTYYEKMVSGAFDILKNEKAYLMGIAKHVWIRQYKEGRNKQPLEQLQSKMDTAARDEKLSSGRLMRFLETAGQKCMEMLRAFYYDRLPLQEIANQFGYSGIRSATVGKYKCLEKVRDNIKERALTYEDFLE